MRYRPLCAFWILSLCAPAHAMNWEGHDDWMGDYQLGLEYAGGGRADPAPLPPCEATETALNPYEQVPLPNQNCRDMPSAAPHPAAGE
jgi:hypothetical protein